MSQPSQKEEEEPFTGKPDRSCVAKPFSCGVRSEPTTNNKDWWVDTGATRHICSEKLLFSDYQKLEQDEQLFMRNSAVSKVERKRKVILKRTSGKKFTLNDVLHVPDIRKNLISESLLSKKGFRMIFESDKFVLTKGGMYVGKRVILLMAFLRPLLQLWTKNLCICTLSL